MAKEAPWWSTRRHVQGSAQGGIRGMHWHGRHAGQGLRAAKSGVVPHVQAAVCINAALGGIIEFKVDGSANVVGRIEVSRPMSEGGAAGRRLRHTGMLT